MLTFSIESNWLWFKNPSDTILEEIEDIGGINIVYKNDKCLIIGNAVTLYNVLLKLSRRHDIELI